jgi:hypothetical protein
MVDTRDQFSATQFPINVTPNPRTVKCNSQHSATSPLPLPGYQSGETGKFTRIPGME